MRLLQNLVAAALLTVQILLWVWVIGMLKGGELAHVQRHQLRLADLAIIFLTLFGFGLMGLLVCLL